MNLTSTVLAVGVASMLTVPAGISHPAAITGTPAVESQVTQKTEVCADISGVLTSEVSASLNMVSRKTHEETVNQQKKTAALIEQEREEEETLKYRKEQEEKEKQKAEKEREEAALRSETEKEQKSNAPVGDVGDNLYWLSHLIFAEAGDGRCSDQLQLWVGSVVLNRVASPLYPSTIRGVIFDTYPTLQYGCTRGGLKAPIYKEPNERAVRSAKYLLEHGSVLPAGVMGQQNKVDHGWSYYGTINGVVFSSYTPVSPGLVSRQVVALDLVTDGDIEDEEKEDAKASKKKHPNDEDEDEIEDEEDEAEETEEPEETEEED